MTAIREHLIQEIERTAAEAGATEIEIITAMQGACVKADAGQTLELLCSIKNDYIAELNIL